MEHKCKKTDLKNVEKCELNREQIIKALECISSKEDVLCEGCGYRKCEGMSCQRNAAKDALSLIKELTEKYENLEMQFREIDHECDRLEIRNEELSEENERLTEELAKSYKTLDESMNFYCSFTQSKVSNCPIDDEVAKAKVDTLSELKIRLTREVGTYLSISIMKVSDMLKLIDQIVEEIIGG